MTFPKRLWESGLIPFSMRRSFAGWRTLRNANRAVEQVGEGFDQRDHNGKFFVYSICGWGVTSDCTSVVQLDESLD